MSMNKKLALTAGTLVALMSSTAFAQQSAPTNINDMYAWAAAAAGFAVGLGVLGGTLGQGRAAAAALEGISRNPGAQSKMMTPMILGLALIESLVLFSLVIGFSLLGKITGAE
jgi:F-type H+-transporting ATPase subunit c